MVILKSQQSFKSNHHKVYTEEVNKIALSSDDDKRLQAFHRVTTYLTEQTRLKCAKVKCWWEKSYSLKNYNKIILQQ